MCTRVPKIMSDISVKQKKMSSTYYLKKAKQFCAQNNYPDAYKNFVDYFESLEDASQSTPAVQLAFTKLVCRIGIVLEEASDTEELLKVYLQALNLFASNYIILNNLGGYLFRIGEVDIARRYLDLAVSYSKNYLPAEKNLMHCKWQQVPRWHFRMLNDIRRNKAYYNAITHGISCGFNKIIDIGAGCGLLSLIASQNPNTKVIAIEENKVLHKMSESIFKENNITNVKLINRNSTKLSEPQGSCNFIVTEIFDVALFGERMLETLVHAQSILITEKTFKIVPSAARLYATAISSLDLWKKYSVVTEIPELKIKNMCIKQIDSEPYEAEYLSQNNVKYMSETCPVMDIDFYDIEQLSEMWMSNDYRKNIEIKCTSEGWIHALGVWFDLYLDEDNSITTNPLSDECVKCWEQGVFYLDHPVFVKKDDILSFQLTVLDSQLKFAPLFKMPDCEECWLVSKEIISFLNDEPFVNSIITVSKKFPQADMTFMDLNCFPLLGFLLAKQGCKVYTAIKRECDLRFMEFFDYILRINSILSGKMIVLEQKITYNPSMCIFHEYLSESKLCFIDPINVDGSLQQMILFKKKVLPKFNSIIMPTSIKVNILLIYSEYLEICNRVNDKCALNFKIGKFMNEYTGGEHPDLDYFPHVAFSNPVTFSLDEDYVKISQNIVVSKDGVVNGLYTWFDLTFYDDVTFSTLESSHFKKSCYILESKEVQLGDVLRVSMRREEAFMDIEIN